MQETSSGSVSREAPDQGSAIYNFLQLLYLFIFSFPFRPAEVFRLNDISTVWLMPTPILASYAVVRFLTLREWPLHARSCRLQRARIGVNHAFDFKPRKHFPMHPCRRRFLNGTPQHPSAHLQWKRFVGVRERTGLTLYCSDLC